MFSRIQQVKMTQQVVKALAEADIMDGRTLNGVFLMGVNIEVQEDACKVVLHLFEEATRETWDSIDDAENPNVVPPRGGRLQAGVQGGPSDEYLQRHFVVVIDEEGNVTAYEEH